MTEYVEIVEPDSTADADAEATDNSEAADQTDTTDAGSSPGGLGGGETDHTPDVSEYEESPNDYWEEDTKEADQAEPEAPEHGEPEPEHQESDSEHTETPETAQSDSGSQYDVAEESPNDYWEDQEGDLGGTTSSEDNSPVPSASDVADGEQADDSLADDSSRKSPPISDGDPPTWDDFEKPNENDLQQTPMNETEPAAGVDQPLGVTDGLDTSDGTISDMSTDVNADAGTGGDYDSDDGSATADDAAAGAAGDSSDGGSSDGSDSSDDSDSD